MWIGAIGLRYVSGDIDYEKLGYSELFTNYLKRRVGDFDVYIEKLEKMCSVIFAYTFLLFFIFMSLILATFWFVAFVILSTKFIDFADGSNPDSGAAEFGIFVMIVLLLGLFLLIDFVTFGGFKKIKDKTVSKAFMVIYRVFSWMTLSFLYRPLLYNFIDHTYTRRLFLLSIPYFIIVFMVVPAIYLRSSPYFPDLNFDDNVANVVRETSVLPYTYDNLRIQEYEKSTRIKRERINVFSLNADVIEKPFGTVFIAYRESDERYLGEILGIQPIFKTGLRHPLFKSAIKDSLAQKIKDGRSEELKVFYADRRKNRTENDTINWDLQEEEIMDKWKDSLISFNNNKIQTIKDSLQGLVDIQIDKINYNDSLSCKFYTHPNLGEKGLLCYFPTRHLSDGEHLMELRRRVFNRDLTSTTWYYPVPFWVYLEN